MDDNRNIAKKAVSGLFWTFGERIFAQFISLVVTLVLARILDPDHYGIVSIVTVFISFCNVFVSSGFGVALVQKKTVDEEDFNTGFTISFAISIILYIVLFCISPYIERFYNIDSLSLVIRVMGLRLPIAAINSIQHSYIQREMMFKRFFIATSVGTIISGVVGIILAVRGFGVWALVCQYLLNTSIDTIMLLFISSWRPSFKINIVRANKIFSFGWKILVGNMVDNFVGEVRSLIVAKVFGASDLAFYDQGKKYPGFLVNNIISAISKVMFPIYSKSQDDIKRLKSILRKSIRLCIFILAPILIGFVVIARDFTLIVLTEKWLPVVTFLQIFAIHYLTRPLEMACREAILAIGRSDVILKIMIIINTSSIISVILAVFYFRSVLILAVGTIPVAFISISLYMYYSSRCLGYTLKEELEDILPPIAISCIMALAIVLLGHSFSINIFAMIIKILVGMVVYIILSYACSIWAFRYIIKIIKSYFKRNVS